MVLFCLLVFRPVRESTYDFVRSVICVILMTKMHLSVQNSLAHDYTVCYSFLVSHKCLKGSFLFEIIVFGMCICVLSAFSIDISVLTIMESECVWIKNK